MLGNKNSKTINVRKKQQNHNGQKKSRTINVRKKTEEP